MRGYFYIFDKGYNKILDLIGVVDPNLDKVYKNFAMKLSNRLVNRISGCENFSIDNEDFHVELSMLVNSLWLDHIKKREKYLAYEIYVHRLFEEDLFVDELNYRLFRFGFRNSEKKSPDLKLYYEEKDGKLKYMGSNDEEGEFIIDTYWDVYLERREDDNFYLICKKEFRGAVIYENEVEITFDELMQCVETEDEYEEDWDVEFDADFDL